MIYDKKDIPAHSYKAEIRFIGIVDMKNGGRPRPLRQISQHKKANYE